MRGTKASVSQQQQQHQQPVSFTEEGGAIGNGSGRAGWSRWSMCDSCGSQNPVNLICTNASCSKEEQLQAICSTCHYKVSHSSASLEIYLKKIKELLSNSAAVMESDRRKLADFLSSLYYAADFIEHLKKRTHEHLSVQEQNRHGIVNLLERLEHLDRGLHLGNGNSNSNAQEMRSCVKKISEYVQLKSRKESTHQSGRGSNPTAATVAGATRDNNQQQQSYDDQNVLSTMLRLEREFVYEREMEILIKFNQLFSHPIIDVKVEDNSSPNTHHLQQQQQQQQQAFENNSSIVSPMKASSLHVGVGHHPSAVDAHLANMNKRQHGQDSATIVMDTTNNNNTNNSGKRDEEKKVNEDKLSERRMNGKTTVSQRRNNESSHLSLRKRNPSKSNWFNNQDGDDEDEEEEYDVNDADYFYRNRNRKRKQTSSATPALPVNPNSSSSVPVNSLNITVGGNGMQQQPLPQQQQLQQQNGQSESNGEVAVAGSGIAAVAGTASSLSQQQIQQQQQMLQSGLIRPRRKTSGSKGNQKQEYDSQMQSGNGSSIEEEEEEEEEEDDDDDDGGEGGDGIQKSEGVRKVRQLSQDEKLLILKEYDEKGDIRSIACSYNIKYRRLYNFIQNQRGPNNQSIRQYSDDNKNEIYNDYLRTLNVREVANRWKLNYDSLYSFIRYKKHK